MNQQKLKTTKIELDLSNNITEQNDDSQYINDSKIIRTRTKLPFWSENPNILFNQKYIFEFFPIENMTYEQKLNAVTRTIILLTLVGFFISYNLRILIISGITIGAIFLLYYYHKKELDKDASKKISNDIKESFENPSIKYLKDNTTPIPDNIFEEVDSSNPFGNVLMTDYEYNVNKKPAPPAFNKNINDNILKQAKLLVSEANPDQPDIADKLFKDLGEQLVFEQSLRPFNSNPNTTIPNDQGAFADFCYGGMISCKEGNQFACSRNLYRHTN
jgi:hypothetical protein